MKLNIKLEQCGAGWKVFAEMDDMKALEELELLKPVIESAAQFSMALPGWNVKESPEATSEEQEKWRKAYFARKAWNKGLSR